MLKVKILTLAAVSAILFVGEPCAAQQWQQIPSSYTNSQGYRVTGVTARVTGSGCAGGQNYVKAGDPSDKGYSAKRWTTATKQDGGTVCSGGTWYYGGSKAGQLGGSESDLLIKDGKFYRRG